MKWILLVFLVSTNAFGSVSIWIPNEKEIWSLIRKAERTPEMQIKFKHPGIEKLNVDRRYELATSCPGQSHHRGILKISNFETNTGACQGLLQSSNN